MNKSTFAIFAVIAVLYAALCWFYIDILIRSHAEINLRTLLPILFSAIIIFVPLYKKYIKK